MAPGLRLSPLGLPRVPRLHRGGCAWEPRERVWDSGRRERAPGRASGAGIVCVCARPRGWSGGAGVSALGAGGGAACAGSLGSPGRLSPGRSSGSRGESFPHLPVHPVEESFPHFLARPFPLPALPPRRARVPPDAVAAVSGFGGVRRLPYPIASIGRPCRLHWLRFPIPRPPHPGEGRAQSLAGSSPKSGRPSTRLRCGRCLCFQRPPIPQLVSLRVGVEYE